MRLVKIVRGSLNDAYNEAHNTITESVAGVDCDARVKKLLCEKGVYLSLTHDSVRRALNQDDRKMEQIRKDISQLRNAVVFPDECKLISNYDAETRSWSTTIPFKIGSSSDLDLPFSPKSLPYYQAGYRDVTGE